MAYLALIVVSATIISLIVTPLLRWLATNLGVVDNPNERKLHVSPVPLLGGVAIYSGMVVAAAFFSDLQPHLRELSGVLLGATLVMGLGLWDDRHGMKPSVKLG